MSASFFSQRIRKCMLGTVWMGITEDEGGNSTIWGNEEWDCFGWCQTSLRSELDTVGTVFFSRGNKGDGVFNFELIGQFWRNWSK